ncbi:MAG TPA: rod shape-determining protein [Candidatus Magasanikbacteria bacterium]|nr:rod shape-determining protein [Candidatus Magasanikbacteria bacterium]
MKFSWFQTKSRSLAIDLGTANTLVYSPEHGIVINEPSVVAINTKTEQILAVGHEAKEMLGKTPPHIEVTRPLSGGVISDYEVTEKMLKFFIEKVTKSAFAFATRPRVVIAVPLDVTEVEIKAVEDATLAAGAKEVFIVQEPMAAAIGSRMPVREPVGNMIVDIGGGNTEIAVISLSGVVTWKSTKIAGDEMNKNIIQYAREVFKLLVGEAHAEEIKIKAGSALPRKERVEFPMRGRDSVTGLPKEIMISDEHIRQALSRSVKTIVDHIKMTLEVTPPELTADIHERGILLVGGGALLEGLDVVIGRAAEIPVRVADDPLTSVVRGAGVLLEDEELLKQVVLPSAREV